MSDLEHLRAYLEENRLMTVATVGVDGAPWASTVFFAFDQTLHLYFFSDPETQHCRNIATNPRVAVAINQVWGGHGVIRGVQLLGTADRPSGDDADRALALYRTRHSWVTRFLTDHVIFRIAPSEIWMIDSVRFLSFHRKRIV